MRKIDADAIEQDLMQCAKNAEQAGDGEAAGIFIAMALIVRHAPTVPDEAPEGRDAKRNS